MKKSLLKSAVLLTLFIVTISCNVDVESDILQEEPIDIELLAKQWTTIGLDLATMEDVVKKYRSLNSEELRTFINVQDTDASYKEEQLYLLETSMSQFGQPYNSLDHESLKTVIEIETFLTARERCKRKTYTYDLTASLDFFDSFSLVNADSDYNNRSKNSLDNIPEEKCNLREIHYTNTMVDVMIPRTAAGLALTQHYQAIGKEFVVRIDPSDALSVYVATEKAELRPFFRPKRFQRHFKGMLYADQYSRNSLTPY